MLFCGLFGASAMILICRGSVYVKVLVDLEKLSLWKWFMGKNLGSPLLFS